MIKKAQAFPASGFEDIENVFPEQDIYAERESIADVIVETFSMTEEERSCVLIGLAKELRE